MLAVARPPAAGDRDADPVHPRHGPGTPAARCRRRAPGRSRAPHRGATYRTIFALCYGLGLRGGEACALRVGDIDRNRELLVVKGGKFGKSRLVPHGPRIGELLDRAARAPRR